MHKNRLLKKLGEFLRRVVPKTGIRRKPNVQRDSGNTSQECQSELASVATEPLTRDITTENVFYANTVEKPVESFVLVDAVQQEQVANAVELGRIENKEEPVSESPQISGQSPEAPSNDSCGKNAQETQVAKQVEESLDKVLLSLKTRYAETPASTLVEVLRDNRDLPVTSINGWSQMLYHKTAKEILIEEAIVAEEKKENAAERLEKVTRQLEDIYSSKKAKTINEINRCGINISTAVLTSLVKQVTGQTLSKYLIEKGILEYPGGKKDNKRDFGEIARVLSEVMKAESTFDAPETLSVENNAYHEVEMVSLLDGEDVCAPVTSDVNENDCHIEKVETALTTSEEGQTDTLPEENFLPQKINYIADSLYNQAKLTGEYVSVSILSCTELNGIEKMLFDQGILSLGKLLSYSYPQLIIDLRLPAFTANRITRFARALAKKEREESVIATGTVDTENHLLADKEPNENVIDDVPISVPALLTEPPSVDRQASFAVPEIEEAIINTEREIDESEDETRADVGDTVERDDSPKNVQPRSKLAEKLGHEIKKDAPEISISRSELRAHYVDTREIAKSKVDPRYAYMLNPAFPKTPEGRIRYKIIKQFEEAELLCEIDVSDDEYEFLRRYTRNFCISRTQNRSRMDVDILVAVTLVQIGIRFYDGAFWPHVSKALNIRFTVNKQNELGAAVTQTLRVFGKSVFAENEYVTNILMHGFIVDTYAQRAFDYLFQYYNIEFQRDIRDMRDADLEELCASVINPFSKRQQLISNYMGMSVRAEKAYCKAVFNNALHLIDQHFWSEFEEGYTLPARPQKEFERWIDSSDFYKEEKRRSEKVSDERKRVFRTPQLHCDMENAEFSVVLPAQLIRDEDKARRESFYWGVTVNGKTEKHYCPVAESFSGYAAQEQVIKITPSEQFEAYGFTFGTIDETLRSYKWKSRVANFFDIDGTWINSERLPMGECFAYTRDEDELITQAILSSRSRNGVYFYELYFHGGELIQVKNEANYFVGAVPQNGITDEARIEDAFLCSKEEKLPLYSKSPNIIFGAKPKELAGIAVFVNGVINRLTNNDYLELLLDKCEESYFLLKTNTLQGIKEGINHVLLDFPASSKRISGKFGLITGLRYEFEDAPYVFQPKGTLWLNCSSNSGSLYGTKRGETIIDFSLEETKDNIYEIPVILDGDEFLMQIGLPVFLSSRDNRDWDSHRWADCWHAELPETLYIKCPTNKISLCVGSADGVQTFRFAPNADSIFACDLTKIKAYLYDGKILKKITVVVEDSEYDFINVVMRSYLVNATLEADYEKEKIICRFETLGKNRYFADVECEGKNLISKQPIENGIIAAQIELKSAEYTVNVYEQEDEFSFDDEYNFVGTSSTKLIDPGDLSGRSARITAIVSTGEQGEELSIDGDFYLYFTEKRGQREYYGFLCYAFNKAIISCSKVCITLMDASDITKLQLSFLDEYEEETAFVYDRYRHVIREEEQSGISKSEAYRRYEVIYSEDYYWRDLYDEKLPDLTEEIEKRIKQKKSAKKPGGIVWHSNDNRTAKDIPITELNLTIRTFNGLKRAKVNTLGDVAEKYKANTLMKVRNLGRKSLNELEQKLKDNGLI